MVFEDHRTEGWDCFCDRGISRHVQMSSSKFML